MWEVRMRIAGEAAPARQSLRADPCGPDCVACNAVREEVARLTQLSLEWCDTTGARPLRTGALNELNPATAEFFDERTRPALRHWRLSQVPRAAALVPMQRVEAMQLTDGFPISTVDRVWFTHQLDARGIRSRAAVLRALLAGDVAARAGRPRRIRWLSIAAGASLPILDALADVSAAGARVEAELVDYDRGALDLAEQFARELGVGRRVRTRRMNVLRRQGLEPELPAESYDLVEMLGLFEYLGDVPHDYTYAGLVPTGRSIGAVGLLHNAWRLVRPGGRLVVANMRDDRPELDFLTTVLQWPHIEPRSIDQVVRLFDRAGIHERRIRVDTPMDGVYGVFSVVKARSSG